MRHLIIVALVFLFIDYVHSQTTTYDAINSDSCLETRLSSNKTYVICYDRFHNITRQGLLIKGMRQGKWNLYMDGEILRSGRYKNNKKRGVWKEFYLNGKEVFVGKYKNDLETGIWRVYLSDKDLRLPNVFDQKRLTEIRKYKNGKLLEKKIFDSKSKCISTETW